MNCNAPCQIAIVDDQSIFTDSLSMALPLDGTVEVRECFNNPLEALDALPELGVEVVLMDIAMPEMTGIELFAALEKTGKRPRIIGMSGLVQAPAFAALWADGIEGLVHKNDSLESLQGAVEAVCQGGRFLSDSLKEKLACDDSAQRYEELTGREREVLRALCEGLSSREVGEALGISQKTARNHRDNLMAKLELHSTAELMRFGMAVGLVGAEDLVAVKLADD